MRDISFIIFEMDAISMYRLTVDIASGVSSYCVYTFMGYDIKEKKVNKHTQDYVAWISLLPENKPKKAFSLFIQP